MSKFIRETLAERPIETLEQVHYKLKNIVLIFFIFCFSGWIWEVIYIAFTEGVLAKRGMLHGPWLPIYGVGGVLILLILGRFKAHPPLVFILAVLLCGTMEYSAALIIEAVFRCRWWDYSDKFMNLNGRVCIGGMMLFGIAGTSAVCKFGPLLHDKIDRLSPDLRRFLNIVLCAVFFIDVVFSLIFPNRGIGVTYPILTRIY